MPISLQRSGLTGRRIMSPLSTYSGLTRPPRAISAPQDVTPEAVMPEAVSLPGAIRPDTGLGLGGDGPQRGLPSGITQEDIDNLDPITMKDVRANAGRLAAYGIPLAMSAGNPMSLVLPGAADLLATGVKKGIGYLSDKAFGGESGQKGVHDAFAAYSEKGLGYNIAGERASGINYSDPPRVISAEEEKDKGWFGGGNESVSGGFGESMGTDPGDPEGGGPGIGGSVV